MTYTITIRKDFEYPHLAGKTLTGFEKIGWAFLDGCYKGTYAGTPHIFIPDEVETAVKETLE